MSFIRFQCYVCSQELQVGMDKAGRKAKCIQCGTVLTIPSGPTEEMAPPGPPPSGPMTPLPPTVVPPPGGNRGDPEANSGDEPAPRRRAERGERPGDDYDRPRRGRRDDEYDERGRDERRSERGGDDDYDRPRRRREEPDDRGRDDLDDFDDRGKVKKWKSQWPKVRVGMLVSLIGMGVVAGAYLLEHLGVLIAMISSFSRQGPDPTSGYVGILFIISSVVGFLGFLCLMAGQVFWIFISNKHGGLVWAIVALSVGGLSLIFYLVFRMIPMFSLRSLPYGPLAYIRFSGEFGGGRVSLGYALLPSFVLIFVSIHGMMIGFYMRSLGKSLKDQLVVARGMQIVIAAATSAGYQLIWPFIGWTFIANLALGIPTTGSLIGIWIFYFGGVIALMLLYVAITLTLNMGRIITDV